MENPPFKEVFPIENGTFPMSCESSGVYLRGVTNSLLNKNCDLRRFCVFEDAIQLDALSIDFDLQSATAGSHPMVTSVGGNPEGERGGKKQVRRN